MIEIIVTGAVPAPQGSKSFVGMHGGRAVLVESSKKVTPWRNAVKAAALNAFLRPLAPIDEPVILLVDFYLPRPASAPKRVWRPAKYPDIDKLMRSTMDGLKMGGILADDARVVDTIASKHFAPETGPGASIRVISATPDLSSKLLTLISELEKSE